MINTVSGGTSGGSSSSSGDKIVALDYAAAITLEDNKMYSLVATGDVAFTLPTVSDAKLHQIFLQLQMDTAVTIDLGTTNYFKGTAPDMTVAGMYNIIWEYDVNKGVWVVDAVLKGEA